MEKIDSRSRSVEADGVADARILRGVVAEDDGDALFGVGLASERGVAGGKPGQVVHAVGLGDVALHTAGGQGVRSGAGVLFEGHGHGDDPAVELGEGDVHGRIYGTESQGTILPVGAAAGADDALDDGNVQVVEEFLGPTGGDGGARSTLLVVKITHGQAHSVDDAVHAREAVGIDHVLRQGVAAVGLVVVRLMLEAVGKDRQDVDVLGLQAGNQVVNESQVPAHPMGAIEQHANGGTARVPSGEAVVGNGRTLGNLGMVDALPRHGRRRFVPEIAAEVGIGEE